MPNFVNLTSIPARLSAHVACESCAHAVASYWTRDSIDLLEDAEDLFETVAVGWAKCGHGTEIVYRDLPVVALLGS